MSNSRMEEKVTLSDWTSDGRTASREMFVIVDQYGGDWISQEGTDWTGYILTESQRKRLKQTKTKASVAEWLRA